MPDRRIDEQFSQGELARFLARLRHVVEQSRVDAATDGADNGRLWITFPHTSFHAVNGRDAIPAGELVKFVDNDERGRTVAGRRRRTDVDRFEVCRCVNDIDESTEPHARNLAEANDPGKRDRLR